MIEKHQVDNGNFILPAGAQYPDWAIDRINHFKNIMVSLSNDYRDPTKEFYEKIVKALEMFILPKDIKITKALTKPEIENLVNKIEKVTFTFYCNHSHLLNRKIRRIRINALEFRIKQS